MGKVIDKLEELLKAKKQYSLNCKRLRESGKYTAAGLQEKISKLKSELEDNIYQTLQEVETLIDEKAATLIAVNTMETDVAYQQLIANSLTKLNMMGENITVEVLQSILKPIIAAKDTETISVIRAFVRKVNNEVLRVQLLDVIPPMQDERRTLKNWKQSIFDTFKGVDYNLNGMPVEEMMLIQMRDTIIADI